MSKRFFQGCSLGCAQIGINDTVGGGCSGADASAFLFPSILEACPQTLIEAMTFGLPIAASISPFMPEICRDAAVYFNPSEPEDIAAKIDMLLTNKTLKENLSEKALARCAFFNWDKTASELIRVFQKVSDSR